MLCFSAITDSRCVSRLLLSPLNFSKGHYFLRLLPHNLPWRQVSLTGAPSTYAVSVGQRHWHAGRQTHDKQAGRKGHDISNQLGQGL